MCDEVAKWRDLGWYKEDFEDCTGLINLGVLRELGDLYNSFAHRSDGIIGRHKRKATQACAMKMEFRRLADGKRVLPDRRWHEGLPAELLEHAKAALMSFYDGNEHDFWAKPQFRDGGLPEEVRIVDDAGKVVARYDAREAIADYLVGKVNVKIGRNFLE
jgi:hypothetical protein